MGFGNSLCFDTQVNFAAGHVEQGALYEVRDKRGRQHTVMVPYVCNNVAVLGEEADEDGYPPPPVPPPRRVPEPPVWSLALVALGSMAWLRRRGHRSRVSPDGRRQGTSAPCVVGHAHPSPSSPVHRGRPARTSGSSDAPARGRERRGLRAPPDRAGQ
jgi:hypothetical protein